MKTILAIFVIVNLFFLGVIAGLFVLSETYPFQPGDSLYGLQGAAEGWRLNLTPGEETFTLYCGKDGYELDAQVDGLDFVLVSSDTTVP